MSETVAFSRDTDLTGLWSGEYWYGAGAMPTPFSAHIIDSGGSITGTTLEPATFGAPGLTELSADISGARGALTVRFTKIYHPAPGVGRHAIIYTGTVDERFTLIDGDWRTGGTAGRFVLVRASRGVQALTRERSAQAEARR
jgi:hypothetical protein